jgi:hypothetical protein
MRIEFNIIVVVNEILYTDTGRHNTEAPIDNHCNDKFKIEIKFEICLEIQISSFPLPSQNQHN